MQFVAKARYVGHSPYKLRPLADVIRGKNVAYALAWLATISLKKAVPIRKMIASAAANAKSLNNLETTNLQIREICVDEGPRRKYFKPRAMGRAGMYMTRFSHMNVVLEPAAKKEA